jgi:hypothetical protein
MRGLPHQMLERVTSRRFVPVASVSAEGQLSDLLDPDQLVRGVPQADFGNYQGKHLHLHSDACTRRQ